ncbi:uncharacterized protein UBRO2_01557 [Ustilago bromivora]|uniref:Histone H1 n=1 Tax=Ustilago bromivora TaxID=307758 RepID=A0A8H8QJ87_9BASI|nr:uncharacterized protein UBRO2_01557 [Ustilago bromivora]
MTIPSEAIAADPWRDPHFTLQRTRAWFKSSPCLPTATSASWCSDTNSSTDAAVHHVTADGGSTRRHDPSSASASTSKVTSAPPASSSSSSSTTTNNAASSTGLGTLAKPIDLASPPASPTSTATTPNVVASESTRPLNQPSPSPSGTESQAASTSAPQTGTSNAAASISTAADAASLPSSVQKGPPYGNALNTPNRLLPPTPLGNTSDRASATSPSAASSTPSKTVQLPAPYKAPRIAKSGASESFATAYPTQETRQKYASPSKPLAFGSGLASSHKRSWQSSRSFDLSNKKFRTSSLASPSPAAASTSLTAPTASASPSPSATAARPLASAPTISRPLLATPTAGRATSASSGVTLTNIPMPGSSLSNQAGVGPLNLIPAVSGTDLPASLRDEYLSLLQKSELIDLVKQLERQLNDLIAAPVGSSTLYRQAHIYPSQIHTQIDRLKARQRVEAAKTTTSSDLSLKDVYSLLNASTSTSGTPTFTRPAGVPTRPTASNPLLTGRPAFTPSTAPRRPYATNPMPISNTGAARGTARQEQASKDTAQNASLVNLINSINAIVRQQAQPARGPNGAPLPPAQAPSGTSATPPATTATGKGGSSAPSITPAALRSIVGDGPMPSNAALAAAIAAHFGNNLPGRATATASRPANASATSASPSANTSAERTGAASSQAPAAPPTAASASGPGKDISDKIATILGSTSSLQTTMLGPQGLPLAPAAQTPGAGAGSSPLPIGNIAAMLSSFSDQLNQSNPSAGSAKSGTPAASEGQENALSSLLQQLEEAKKRLPSQATASSASANAPSLPAVPSASNLSALQDPIAILTGASANPVFTPTYSAGGASATTSTGIGGASGSAWSPEAESVIVQGPLGTSTLPSYEEMIVEGLRIHGQAPPRELFNWMQSTYPLMKKFRPSAHQALQKAAKRGRLLKTGSRYRLNPNWKEPADSRKPTRRPQVGRDHPMLAPGLNGEVLAVSPLKDSQAYRNVGDSGLRTPGKGTLQKPRPYGQPGAAPLANPASSIFQNGSAASIILEYQKRTGKKLDADSVKQLYQLIRSGPSDGPAEEILAHLLTQAGYHDAAAQATAAAAAQTAAAAMPASMPSYPPSSTSMSAMASGPSASGTSAPVSALGRAGAAAASTAARGRMPTRPVPKGPTSLPLATTSEPTMMQQLASMLNDLSSPINPVLANSLLGQLSSNAAAAARAANMPGMSTAPPLPATPARTMASATSAPTSASSQLATALSSLAGQTPQQDLDSAVSETLAAALQQIGAAPTSTAAPSTAESARKEKETVSEAATTAPKQPAESQAAEKQSKKGAAAAAAGESGEAAEEGIDLAEYEDAIRALISAFGKSNEDTEEGDSDDESDVEADERAIAAAEAEPDSVEDSAAESTDAAGQADKADATQEAQHEQQQQQQDEAEEGGEEEGGEEGAGEEEADSKEDSQASKDASKQAYEMDVDQPREEAPAANTEGAKSAQTETAGDGQHASQEAQAEEGSQDAASLQAQLEALVASLAANAGNADDDDDDESEDGENKGDDAQQDS